ncbi:MAG: phosphatase PAP2 family protein [Bacteroidetes bacterium]|nr:phosphatase PAP2 family protein [Bacteroidota bacterium]
MKFTKFIKNQAFKDFAIIILLLGVITLVFRYTNTDIALQRYFYSPEKGWLLQYKPFWDFIYRFGIFPGYFLAFAGLIMITLSYWNVKYIHYRKASMVLVFTIVVGPGVLVNLLLKDHTGRPRPREITEFGGTEKYVCVCEKGDTNEGKSFPCGHCSMGFYLAIPYLFLRNRKRLLACSFLVLGIGYGVIIGIARMMAGGHFASDVLWAGGLVWLIALTGHYLFRVDKPIEMKILSSEDQKKKARRITLAMGILLPIITIGLLLATPYISSKQFHVTNSELAKIRPRVILFDLKNASVRILPDTAFHLEYKVNAFGFPNSKIRGHWTIGDTCRYTFESMGWFTELKNEVKLALPVRDSCSFLIRINKGKIINDLPEKYVCKEINLPGNQKMILIK